MGLFCCYFYSELCLQINEKYRLVLRSVLFWAITQQVVVVPYQHLKMEPKCQ